jgi:murein DD-endopeptidase MepM/ murein hydrolase activator NlpD
VRTAAWPVRVHPVTGEYKLHTGVDFAASTGTHILAAADGRVAFAGPVAGYGHLILIEHTVGGQRVATGYAPMYADGIHIRAGETVTAGQYIADVGSDGYSTGSHLHFEVRPGALTPRPSTRSRGSPPTARPTSREAQQPVTQAATAAAPRLRTTATTLTALSMTRPRRARSPSAPRTS